MAPVNGGWAIRTGPAELISDLRVGIPFITLVFLPSPSTQIPLTLSTSALLQMATLRSNNLHRAAYRAKCRKKLSEHIRKI